MELNNKYTNDPTVGIYLFESLPPVGNKDLTIQWEKFNQTPPFINTEDISVGTENNQNAKSKKLVVKGFGNTTLFTASLIMASKQSGFTVRLDGSDTGHILNDAELICERNPSLVKKFCISKNSAKEKPFQQPGLEESYKDLAFDDLNEIFASDYSKKGKGLSRNWRNL